MSGGIVREMGQASTRRRAWRFGDDGWTEVARTIPEEAPVVMTPNDVAFAAVMATPSDLEDLAVGFAVTERLVAAYGEISAVTVQAVDEGYEARLTIPAARAAELASRRRAFAARTSCSLCGLESLDLLLAERPQRLGIGPRLTPTALLRAMAALPSAERLNGGAHGAHAAGWIDADGALAHVRADVGRHNALDKLIGALLRGGLDPAAGTICLTSRCSIEMVLKAASVGVAILAAASSPTELAVRAAEAAGIALIAGVKTNAFDVYACRERLEA